MSTEEVRIEEKQIDVNKDLITLFNKYAKHTGSQQLEVAAMLTVCHVLIGTSEKLVSTIKTEITNFTFQLTHFTKK